MNSASWLSWGSASEFTQPSLYLFILYSSMEVKVTERRRRSTGKCRLLFLLLSFLSVSHFFDGGGSSVTAFVPVVTLEAAAATCAAARSVARVHVSVAEQMRKRRG